MGLATVAVILKFVVVLSSTRSVNGENIPTTNEGPLKPVTVPFDKRLFKKAIDLSDTDPRLRRPSLPLLPEQISVSLSSHYDSLWISWVTGEYQSGDYIIPLDPESVQSYVEYGVYGSDNKYVATGYSLVYDQLNYSSGIIHHVQLTDMEADTLYEYQCGDPSIAAMSDLHYLKIMPVSSSEDYPNRIAVLGNLGLTDKSSSILTHLLSSHPDLVVLVGGLSFADQYFTNGTYSPTHLHNNDTYQPRWDYWGRFMQPLTANVPTMVVQGQHEIEEQADNQAFVSYSSRFMFPSVESGSPSALYYSFNAGGIHFVMLSANLPYDRSSDQYKWLETELRKVDRSTTPWLVAAWSPPWYSTYKDHYRVAECMRVEMEDLLYTNYVDIVFNGQVNGYERSNRVYKYGLDECGPVYITVGDGGSRQTMATEHADGPGNCPTPDPPSSLLCDFNSTSGPAEGMFCWDRQPDYSAYRQSSFGYGILQVKNETHALWSWHREQDSYIIAADIIYIVRQPNIC